MNKSKRLNIRGSLLDKNQLIDHIERAASEHVLMYKSNVRTYPIPFLNEDYKFILETYNLLSKHIRLGIKIHSAGEWILDNFYIIEETVKVIQKDLNIKAYRKLPGLLNDDFFGFARCFVLAEEMIAFSGCKVDSELIDISLKGYQKKKLLSMEELNMLGVFLKISLVKHIKDLCERIYFAEIQKYKVENIIERIIEKKAINNQRFRCKKYSKIKDDNLKYPFIEYMSYKLKRFGKDAIEYKEILEKEVRKTGLSVSEVIQKEHFDIANIKITMGNCINSIKEINRIDFVENYSYMNAAEDILKLDPAGIYLKMDEESKAYYRLEIEKIAKKYKLSEIYIAEKVLYLAKTHENEFEAVQNIKCHVGYYIINLEGKKELLRLLEVNNKRYLNNELKSKIYALFNIINPLFLCYFLFNYLSNYYFGNIVSLMLSLLFYFVFSELNIRIINYFLSKFKKPKIIPKMDFDLGIPDEAKTFVIIPSILKNKEKVEELFRKLEVYYLANKSNNLYFALLGDCSEEKNKVMDFDEEVINAGRECVRKLNKKYAENNFDIFHFIYRERKWNEGEASYIGWERKRGYLELFNKYIKGIIQNPFFINTLEKNKDNLPEIKYVITLDSDTNLNLDSAKKLVGAMEHILNKPIVENGKVVKGYGIMQPRIGMDLSISQKTLFVELFSLKGGVDFYTNAISDIYQDYFDEGIFTGKGIYNVDVYNTILQGEIPENTVLSHDLLEGNYLRCGLLTDVMLLDGYPLRYLPYMLRNHRWNRGDWQIIKWLKSDRLNIISKFKILDNLRRSLVPIFSFLILLIINLFCKNEKIIYLLSLLSLSAIVIPYLLDIINYIVFKQSTISDAEYAYKKFSKEISPIKASFIRIFLGIMFLPYEAYVNLDSMIRSLYRMKVKRKLLEWVTAEDGEKNTKNDFITHLKMMKINIIFGIILLLFSGFFGRILGLLFLSGVYIAYFISKENGENITINEENRRYLDEIAKRIWNFFESYITEENNYLIPDNYQESRVNKIVNRTSSTNIGLEMISIISAYDLGYINFKKAINYLSKILGIISGLNKWNGHLYNWYDIKTLTPLMPRYISTVDSGNFVGYLYIVKEFFVENRNRGEYDYLINLVDDLINNTDFSKLYSEKHKLFSIGFNLEDNRLTDSYYDFLASEARQASLVAIAKRDVPVKHWNSLSRTLTSLNGYKGLISWTGTAFEYLMPNINFKVYRGSLLDESSKFLIMSQILYSEKLGLPWGISESAFNLKDLYNNYQYKAFGIPWLGLKRGLEDDFVISPYSTFLSLEYKLEKGIKNLKRLEKLNGLGKYGFYEAIDFTPGRTRFKGKPTVVKTFMAHHQALSFLAINNLLNKNILKKRFSQNPEIEAVNILLEERMPIQTIITKEKKEKVSKIKSDDAGVYVEKTLEEQVGEINVVSNENYKVIIDDSGRSLSEYKGYMVNNFKITKDIKQGINSYVRNVKTKKVIDVKESAKVVFSPDKARFIKKENNLKIEEIVFLDPNKSIEIRRLEIENIGSSDEVLEIIIDFEPSLSLKMEEYAHPIFNKLFMRLNFRGDNLVFEKRDRDTGLKRYLSTALYTENEQIVDFEYEIDKEKYYGRENLSIPDAISKQKAFSNEIYDLTDPVIAMKRTVRVRPKERVNVNLIISVSENEEDSLENLEIMKSEEEIIRTLSIAQVRSEEEAKYLQTDSKKINIYMSYFKYLLKYNPCKNQVCIDEFDINGLWKYGISGDNPIILVKIKSIEDIYVVEEVLSMYDYYRAKKLYVDLVIVNVDRNQYVRDGVNSVISNKQLDYLKNIKSGIYVIDNFIEISELKMIEYKANIVVDASLFNLETLLKEYDDRFIKQEEVSCRQINNKKIETYPLKKQELLFDNSYGGFSLDGKEYLIYKSSENKLPSVWCNILANPFFGTVITDNLGGYTWSKNSRLNRITAWNNDRVFDVPSEVFYLKDENSKSYYTLNSGVVPNKNYYYITHGFGFTKQKNINDNIQTELECFVPSQDEVKITKIKIKNLINEDRKLKLLIYLKPVLGEDEIFTNGNIYLEKDENVLFIKNTIVDSDFNGREYFITSNTNINSFTGNKDNFFGRGDILKPDALFKSLDGETGKNSNSCIAMEILIKLDKLEAKDIIIVLGCAKDKENIKVLNEKYLNEDGLEKSREELDNFWHGYLDNVQIKTPDKSLDILMNGWLVYQTITSRIFARTGYYQSGGAYGFRDQLQDALGLKFIDSNFLKNQIILAARHQFIEGDVLHWWHNENKKGVRTKFSDDLLWLVYATLEYISYENNDEILDEEIEYLNGEVLTEDEEERYARFYSSSVKEPLFMHLARAINHVLDKGIEPFPKIGTGDWNDGFSNLGIKEKGSSIWLGFFLYDILNRFIPVCESRGKKELVSRYYDCKEILKKNLNQEGWDGRWYKRAISDDDDIIGSINSDECRIDCIAQSWSVISGAGDNDKKYIALSEAENYLIDEENKIVKLFDPPFEKSKFNPGYIKSYLPGIRENGGQYTHAACWFMIAEAILGFGDKAYEIAKMINPIEHSKTKEQAKIFKLEPYILEADIYTNKDMIGRGGWNWYTGSSSWYFKGVLEYILGLKIENGHLKIEPCIPKEWKEYEIKYKFKSSIYKIKVKNHNFKSFGVEKMILNGEKVPEKCILLQDNGSINEVEIFM